MIEYRGAVSLVDEYSEMWFIRPEEVILPMMLWFPSLRGLSFIERYSQENRTVGQGTSSWGSD